MINPTKTFEIPFVFKDGTKTSFAFNAFTGLCGVMLDNALKENGLEIAEGELDGPFSKMVKFDPVGDPNDGIFKVSLWVETKL